MKRTIVLVIVAAVLLAILFGLNTILAPSSEERPNGGASTNEARPIPGNEPQTTPWSVPSSSPEPMPLGMPRGAAAIPQRPPASTRESPSPNSQTQPNRGGTERPPFRDLTAEPEVVDEIVQNVSALSECHRLLCEREPSTPSQVTYHFELTVEANSGADFGSPRLRSVRADDTPLLDFSCFRQVFGSFRVPQPENDEGYSASLEVSLRTDSDEPQSLSPSPSAR